MGLAWAAGRSSPARAPIPRTWVPTLSAPPPPSAACPQTCAHRRARRGTLQRSHGCPPPPPGGWRRRKRCWPPCQEGPPSGRRAQTRGDTACAPTRSCVRPPTLLTCSHPLPPPIVAPCVCVRACVRAGPSQRTHTPLRPIAPRLPAVSSSTTTTSTRRQVPSSSSGRAGQAAAARG